MPARARILYDVDGWAYHNRALALRKYAPADFAVEIAPFPRWTDLETALGAEAVELLLLLPAPRARQVRRELRRRGWTSALVTGWSYRWPDALDALQEAHAESDWIVFNNRISWERTGRLPRSSVIANGVDLDVFRVAVRPKRRSPKVLWVGSEFYRSCKGYDDFIVPLWAELDRRGIACEALLVDSRGPERRTPIEMAAWYNGGTVLVCASEEEGTPNPALEAAASGCTVVSTAVGNMPELICDGENGYLVERRLDALIAGVLHAVEEYPRLAAEMQKDIASWDWRTRSREYFDLFRGVLDERRR